MLDINIAGTISLCFRDKVVQEWYVEHGVMRTCLDLNDEGRSISPSVSSMGFSQVTKKGLHIGLLRREKAPKSWRSQTLLDFLSLYGPSESAPMKRSSVTQSLAAMFMGERPQILIGDMAYDIDPCKSCLSLFTGTAATSRMEWRSIGAFGDVSIN